MPISTPARRESPLEPAETSARFCLLGQRMEALYRRASGARKKPNQEPVTRDAYGFVVRPFRGCGRPPVADIHGISTGHPARVSRPRPRLTLPPRPLPFAQVKPEHVEAYRRNAPMYVDEEAERATRWDAFLAQKDDNGNDDDDARDGARTLDALVRVLDARAARGSGDDALEESDEERELRALVAGGVPMALRGRCWQIFARVKERRRDGVFRELLVAAGETVSAATETNDRRDEGDGDEEDAVERALASLVDATCEAAADDGSRTAAPNHGCADPTFRRVRKQIDKDLPRTFPGHPLLDGIGRDALRRVLCAYALHNPAVGYCQGMNFLAALLLLLMEEEPAFWCLSALVEDILPGYYGNTMLASAVDQAVLRTFVDARFPRVGAALDDAGVPLAAVTGSWFLTLYVNHLPWETALRVWDVLLFERTRRVLFQTALALIDVNAKRIVEAGRCDRLMECAVSVAPAQFDGSELLIAATCGAFADVTWTEIMSSYASHHSELTKAGVDGTVNGRNNLRASVSAAPTSQLATVGGSGEYGTGDGECPRNGRFPPTPMQEGWAGAESDDSDSEDEDTGGAEGAGVADGGGLAVVDDWFAVRSRIARAPQIVGDGAGQCVVVSPTPPPLADAVAASAAPGSPKRRGRASSYASYMKVLGRSFKGLYSSGGGGGVGSGSTSRDPNPDPKPGRPSGTAARGAGVAGIAPRAAVPEARRDVRVVLAYADDGASDAAVLARALDEGARLRAELEAARMQRDAAADAMEALASRLADATALATARERQLEVMSGVLAIHRDECAGKDAELCALRDENASLRELVERLGEPPGSVVRSEVRIPRSPEGKNAVASGVTGMTETEEEKWAARGGFATPEPAR